MAGFDLLIYNDHNWMDKLSPEELNERLKNNNFEIEYNKPRAKKGDIVQIENSGFFANGGYRKDVFAVVTVDLGDITLKEAKKSYANPSMELIFDNGEPKANIVKFRKHGLGIDSIPLDINKKANINRIQDFLVDRDLAVIG